MFWVVFFFENFPEHLFVYFKEGFLYIIFLQYISSTF